MKRITRNLIIATGATTAAFGAGTFALADFMFHLSLDKRCAGWMEKLMAGGATADYLQTPHADADEEREAAHWFEEAKQPVTAISDDGLKLHGWLFDADKVSPAPHLYAICMHGYTGMPAEMAKYAHRLARLGFTVLVPAQRAHEMSEGRFVGMGWLERRDLMCWIRLIVESDPDARILLDGISMGAATVMMAVGEPDLPRNVVAAIEDCGYSSVWDQFLYNAKGMYHLPRRWMAVPVVAAMSKISKRVAGYRFREASSVDSLRRATIPMLFIHGGDDTFVDPAFLDRNVAACASIDRERLLIPGAAHALSASTDPVRYWKRVTAFVTRVFGL
ncbi:alpha/beta hydrolase [Bifidobacterium miconisargentati]|uniref:alpha/beta hydrolase n=1 Tax=Bifidobacterium miconisargentati TaxID=2834437 RepID=UPI001BDD4436|nr:alpha/beta hydrolase [Bifidobacterium miconisargentati]MBW3090576.1 alpha/beta hydrolase [Bifidobacterium miconisargentati]